MIVTLILEGWLPFLWESSRPLHRPDLLIRRSLIRVLERIEKVS